MSAQVFGLEDLDDLRELARLFAIIWERQSEPPINSDMLRALAHSGNYVAGAWSGDRMVGGLVGWLGGRPPHELHMHSHILGVLPGSDARGLGFALKQHQRDWCLRRSVKAIEWTFDPLVRRNAYFNLTKLGADAVSYLVDFYGSMDDGINAGEESDRVLVRWELDSSKARAAAEGRVRDPELERTEAEGAARILTVGDRGEPVNGELRGSFAVCQVPEDIVGIRRSAPELARSWRLAVRASLGGALEAGYGVVGVTRAGWYVLQSGRG